MPVKKILKNVGDTQFMKMALELALKGQGFTSPNPMVGAVVVKEGRVVGRGYHQALGEAHAEVNAIDDAGPAAESATLYVTLEPCNHSGRTPPCTQKIVNAGIGRVVVAMKDPNPDVRGGGVEFLRSRGIDVDVGTCEREARRLNEAFVKYVETKRPFAILKCAATLDGRIATRTGDSKWVTGEASRAHVHRIRHAADAIMVGVGTVIKDDPSLTARIPGDDGKRPVDPTRVILDTRLRIPESAKLLRLESDSDTIVVTGPSAPDDKKARIERKGVRVMQADVKDDRIDLDRLMDRLGALGLTSLLIEGGGRVIAAALKAGIVDKIIFFYAPRILGGDDGVPICRGPGPALMNESIPVDDLEVRRFGDDVMIEGYVGGKEGRGVAGDGV